MYKWHIAQPEEFNEICALFLGSGLPQNPAYDIKRRVSVPLLFKHLITFRNCRNELCGFVTFAYLDEVAKERMKTVGVSVQDWKSGDDFWTVDFVVKPGEDGYRMMRGIVKKLGLKKVSYFRDKHKKVKELRA